MLATRNGQLLWTRTQKFDFQQSYIFDLDIISLRYDMIYSSSSINIDEKKEYEYNVKLVKI